MPVHLAETRREALAQVHDRATAWVTGYQRDVLSRPLPEGVPEDQVVEALADRGAWIVGTPDDCIATIDRLDERSGGFGGLLVMVQDWATREQQRRSYELLARYVMPRYQGALGGVQSAYRHAADHRLDSEQAMQQSIERAFQARERAADAPVERATPQRV
jgi:limonene 1,2-monooxygenase